MVFLQRLILSIGIFVVGVLCGIFGQEYFSRKNSWGQIKEHHKVISSQSRGVNQNGGIVTLTNPPKIKSALWDLVSEGELMFIDTVLTNVQPNPFTTSFFTDAPWRLRECIVYGVSPSGGFSENVFHIRLWARKGCKEKVEYVFEALKKIDTLQRKTDCETVLKRKLTVYFKKEYPKEVSEAFNQTLRKMYKAIDITERRVKNEKNNKGC